MTEKERNYNTLEKTGTITPTKEELIGMTVSDLHPKDALKNVISQFETQARGKKTLASDAPFLKKDGTIIYLDVNAANAVIDKNFLQSVSSVA